MRGNMIGSDMALTLLIKQLKRSLDNTLASALCALRLRLFCYVFYLLSLSLLLIAHA